MRANVFILLLLFAFLVYANEFYETTPRAVYKISNYSAIQIKALKTESCDWLPNSTMKYCHPIVEIYLPKKNDFKKHNISISLIPDYSTTYNSSYSTKYKTLSHSYCDSTSFNASNNASSNCTTYYYHKFLKFKSIKDASSISLKKGFSAFRFDFYVPKNVSGHYNFSITDNSGNTYKLDPDISACGTLSANASYTLTQDIQVNGSCFKFENNVSLDCGYHTIRGNGTGDAMAWSSPATSLTANVSNCVIENFSNGINFYDDYNTSDSTTYVDNCTIENNTIRYLSGDRGGIYIYSFAGVGSTVTSYAQYNTIKNNTIFNITSGFAIAIISSDGTSHASNNTIINNTITSCGYRGIFLGAGGEEGYRHVQDNLVYNNYIECAEYDLEVYGDASLISNDWNTSKTLGRSIAGGNYLGGNYLGNSTGSGFSDTCTDADGDNICDDNYTIPTVGSDADCLPLTLGQLFSTPSQLSNISIGEQPTFKTIAYTFSTFDGTCNYTLLPSDRVSILNVTNSSSTSVSYTNGSTWVAWTCNLTAGNDTIYFKMPSPTQSSWAQDTAKTSTPTIQYLKSTLTNPGSLALENVTTNNPTSGYTNQNTTISSISASSTMQLNATGDNITQTVNWYQNTTPTNTMDNQYVYANVTTTNGGLYDFASLYSDISSTEPSADLTYSGVTWTQDVGASSLATHQATGSGDTLSWTNHSAQPNALINNGYINSIHSNASIHLYFTCTVNFSAPSPDNITNRKIYRCLGATCDPQNASQWTLFRQEGDTTNITWYSDYAVLTDCYASDSNYLTGGDDAGAGAPSPTPTPTPEATASGGGGGASNSRVTPGANAYGIIEIIPAEFSIVNSTIGETLRLSILFHNVDMLTDTHHVKIIPLEPLISFSPSEFQLDAGQNQTINIVLRAPLKLGTYLHLAEVDVDGQKYSGIKITHNVTKSNWKEMFLGDPMDALDNVYLLGLMKVGGVSLFIWLIIIFIFGAISTTHTRKMFLVLASLVAITYASVLLEVFGL